MKMRTNQQKCDVLGFIQAELTDLAIPKFSLAYKTIMQNAFEAAEIMSKPELKRYIEEYAEILPQHHFA